MGFPNLVHKFVCLTLYSIQLFRQGLIHSDPLIMSQSWYHYQFIGKEDEGEKVGLEVLSATLKLLRSRASRPGGRDAWGRGRYSQAQLRKLWIELDFYTLAPYKHAHTCLHTQIHRREKMQRKKRSELIPKEGLMLWTVYFSNIIEKFTLQDLLTYKKTDIQYWFWINQSHIAMCINILWFLLPKTQLILQRNKKVSL